MTVKTKKRVQKMISFPPELYKMGQQKADVFGLSFPEYVRFLVMNDAKSEPIEMVDEETEKAIGEAYEAYARGEGTIVSSKEELADYLASLHS